MRLEIKFLDDDGNVVMEHKALAEQPSTIRLPEKIIAGQYEIYSASYQPHVRCLYPNGQPPPQVIPNSPFSGQWSGALKPGKPFPDMPGFRSAPTPAPSGRNDFLKQQFKGDEGPNSNPRN